MRSRGAARGGRSLRWRRVPALAFAGALLLAAEAGAGLYRCPAPGGGTVFTDNPNACPGAGEHEPAGAIQKVPSASVPPGPASRAPAPGRAEMQQQAEADMASAWRQRRTRTEEELRALGARREHLLEAIGWCNRGGELLKRDSSGLNRKVSCGTVRSELAALEAQRASAQAYLDEGLEEECRRAGCLPGWIR